MIIISKKGKTLIQVLYIILFLSSIVYSFNFNIDLDNKFIDQSNFSQNHEVANDFKIGLSQSTLFEYSGVGKGQNVTEYGEAYFLNNDINITNNENASVIIPHGWEGNAISCDITNIYEYNAVVVNQTFDNGIDQNRWTNSTSGNPTKFTVGYYNNPTGSNDSIYLKLDEDGGNWEGTSSLINYSFPLLRESIPYEDWYIKYSVKWIMTDNSWRDALPPGSKYVMGLEFSYNDGSSTSREFNLKKPSDIVNNTWYHITMLDLISPLPDLYEYDPPANVSIYFSFGVKDAAYSPVGSLTIYYDNISFEIQSIPKPSTIGLNITDNASGGLKNQPIQDFPDLFGKGYIFLEGSWPGEVGGSTYEFSFSSNSTGNVLIHTNFFVMASSLGYTTTNIGTIGSEFIVENNTKTIWTMYIPISIPGSYSMNYYFNISKPLNWNVTQVIDPYSNNKINEVIGAGLGNSTLTIPNNIITPGIWKIVAEAPNYVELANIFRKNATIWSEDDTFHIDDKLRFNASIKTSLIPSIDNTKGTLKIFGPNGSLWYQEGNVSVDIDGNVEFSEITLGKNNASAGKYYAQIIWHDYDINMSQVGFSLLEFNVVHNTNLVAINSHIEQIAGDPLLLKVKFIDSDLNISIDFATITYNSTFGVFGIMSYQGFGIYVSELDTKSLGLGDYYFSFNASKSYYESHTAINLIKLEIKAQPLALELPITALSSIGNDYAICQINVTGAFSGSLIWPANISTDWQNPYKITDHDNGTFTLNFSTSNLPSRGIIETFTVTVFANRTNYGDTTGFITIIIYPIETLINVNRSIINTDLNDVVDIKVNYSVLGTGSLISGANCSVIWVGSYNVSPDVNGFIISLDTATLSIDTYTATIKLEKSGFETAYKTVTIIINRLNIKVSTMGFRDSIEVFNGDTITIKINLTELGTEIYIENASVFYSWEFGLGYFEDLDDGLYELVIKLPGNIEGSYKMTLIISKEDSFYQPTEFSFIIAITKRSQPNYVFWYIIIGLIIGIGLLGILSLRAYVYLPIKKKKKLELLAKTQRFKDAMNVQGLVISQRDSGLTLYSRSYYALEGHKKDLLSGFIYAITTISKEFMIKEKSEEIVLEQDKFGIIEKVIELDFKYFNFLICDYKGFRVVFILKEEASERLKKQAMDLLTALDSQLATLLDRWDGNLEKIEEIIPKTLDNYCRIYYNDYFVLNKPKYINKVINETELSVMESRIINVIKSMTNTTAEFYLKDILQLVEEENKDLVIVGLESIIDKKLIIPSQKL